jgi:hypothetical protein
MSGITDGRRRSDERYLSGLREIERLLNTRHPSIQADDNDYFNQEISDLDTLKAMRDAALASDDWDNDYKKYLNRLEVVFLKAIRFYIERERETKNYIRSGNKRQRVRADIHNDSSSS